MAIQLMIIQLSTETDSLSLDKACSLEGGASVVNQPTAFQGGSLMLA